MSQTQDRTISRDGDMRGLVSLTMISDPTSPAAEAYRSLRASVKFADVQPSIHSVLVADTGRGAEHSMIAANLATALALAGDTVILVDANLRNPQLHDYFGAQSEPGLADWLATENHNGSPSLQSTSIEGLRIFSAGSVAKLGRSGSTPSDHIGGQPFQALIDRLRGDADFLIFDAPPLSEFGDALAVAARVDAVLLLVHSGRTKRAAAQRAKESLDRIGAHILGVVLTDSGGRFRIRG